MSCKSKLVHGLLWVLMAISGSVHAEVKAASASGFVSEHKLFLPVAPERAYAAMVDEIAAWWDAQHSYSGQASAFSLDARAGGCFCEQHAGVSVEHMRVVNAQAGRRLVMLGGLGPLQNLAVSGSMSFEFAPTTNEQGAAGTQLSYRYSVSGWTPDGLEAWAAPVDQVQLGQLLRLRQYLTTGQALNP